MSKAIDDLRHEHQAIESGLKILDSINRRLEAGHKADKTDLQQFIGFLKEFADKCHHGKEEGILFPALAKAGMPEKGGPIGVMLAEHDQGRKLIKEMESGIGDSANYRTFSKPAREYVGLLRSHIQKENEVLFPAAEKLLPAAQMEGLYEAFEQHEEKVIGHGRHEELHAILEGLKQKYGT